MSDKNKNFLQKNSNFSNKPQVSLIGFELWEVFTMLTVVLSLASSIMWYSNLQPRRIATELAVIESQKHILYNKYLVIKHTIENPIDIDVDLNRNCKSSEPSKQFNTLKWDEELGKLTTHSQSIDLLKADLYTIQISSSVREKYLNNLMTSFKEYLDEAQDVLQNRYQLELNLVKSRSILSKACSLDYKPDLSIMYELGEVVRQLDNSQYSSLKFLNKDVSEFYDLYSLNKKNDVESTNKMQKIYNQVFEIDYGLSDVDGEILDKSENLLFNFKSVESYEKSLLKMNSNLENKVVYIY
ncbi:MAG: hypothetical protein AAGF07_01250 [Patescibacteria group bacterium]